MKRPPSDPEFARFTDAMRGIMQVSKTELNRRLAAEKAEKAEKKGKSNPHASPSPGPGASSKRAG